MEETTPRPSTLIALAKRRALVRLAGGETARILHARPGTATVVVAVDGRRRTIDARREIAAVVLVPDTTEGKSPR